MRIETCRTQRRRLFLHALAKNVGQRDSATGFGDRLGKGQPQTARGARHEHLAASQQPGG